MNHSTPVWFMHIGHVVRSNSWGRWLGITRSQLCIAGRKLNVACWASQRNLTQLGGIVCLRNHNGKITLGQLCRGILQRNLIATVGKGWLKRICSGICRDNISHSNRITRSIVGKCDCIEQTCHLDEALTIVKTEPKQGSRLSNWTLWKQGQINYLIRAIDVTRHLVNGN